MIPRNKIKKSAEKRFRLVRGDLINEKLKAK